MQESREGEPVETCSMKIISASRRTDIPAFYSDWLMNRIRAGYVKVMSPFSRRVSCVNLKPENVLAIVFWTKNAQPLVRYVPELKNRGYSMYFLYTVNNYPKDLEPHTPEMRHNLRTIETISDQFDRQVIRWRYDPVLVTKGFSVDMCLDNFDFVCSKMKQYTRECIFSPCDFYRKTVRKMVGNGLEFWTPNNDETIKMSSVMAEIASGHGVSLFSCAHDFLLGNAIGKAKCVDGGFISNLVQSEEAKNALRNLKTSKSRTQCACADSIDIGAYDTCLHECVYCYATQQAFKLNEELIKSVQLSDCLDQQSPVTRKTGACRSDSLTKWLTGKV